MASIFTQIINGDIPCHKLAEDERDVLCAESSDQWVEAITSLWSEPAKVQQIGRNARRYVEDHHHWRSCLQRFGELVEDASADGADRVRSRQTSASL